MIQIIERTFDVQTRQPSHISSSVCVSSQPPVLPTFPVYNRKSLDETVALYAARNTSSLPSEQHDQRPLVPQGTEYLRLLSVSPPAEQEGENSSLTTSCSILCRGSCADYGRITRSTLGQLQMCPCWLSHACKPPSLHVLEY